MSGGEVQLRNWASLPPDLLQLILGKVEEICDYVRFGIVCKSWRVAANSGNPPPQFPWLLLPYVTNDTLRRFWSRHTGRIYRLDFPIFRGCAIYTFSHGWLLLVDKNLSVSLFHPFTQDRIHLPALPSDPINRYCSFSITNELPPSDTMFKFYLFKSTEGKHIVGLIVAFKKFLYWREHDSTWIMPVFSSSRSIRTVAYHNERFYSYDWYERVAACKLGPEAKFELIPSLGMQGELGVLGHCYLAVVADKLLLLVLFYNSEENSEETWSFDCYKLDDELDDENGQPEWTKIKDIGEHTLFLTSREIVIVTAAGETSGCRRNRIYLCDVSELGLILYGGDVEDDTMQRIGPLDEVFEHHYHRHSCWFIPTLS